MASNNEKPTTGSLLGNLAGGIWSWQLLSNVADMRKTGQLHIPWTSPAGWFVPDKILTKSTANFSASLIGAGAEIQGLSKSGITLGIGQKPVVQQFSRKSSSWIAKEVSRNAARDTARSLGHRRAAQIAGTGVLVGRAATIGLVAFNALFAFDILKGGISKYGALINRAYRARKMDMGGAFFDSEQAYTARQRSVQAINASHLQARSAIGNEAQFMHR